MAALIKRNYAAMLMEPSALRATLATQTIDAGCAYPLGAAPGLDGTNFSLFSNHAMAVTLLLFDRADDAQPLLVVPRDREHNRTSHYWHIFVPGT